MEPPELPSMELAMDGWRLPVGLVVAILAKQPGLSR
jgi:hypothetical protein